MFLTSQMLLRLLTEMRCDEPDRYLPSIVRQSGHAVCLCCGWMNVGLAAGCSLSLVLSSFITSLFGDHIALLLLLQSPALTAFLGEWSFLCAAAVCLHTASVLHYNYQSAWESLCLWREGQRGNWTLSWLPSGLIKGETVVP